MEKIVLDKIEEMRIKKEEEDAKYETNKNNKKTIKNLYRFHHQKK